MSSVNYSIVGQKAQKLNLIQKTGLTLAGLGISIILVAWAGITYENNGLLLLTTLFSIAGGTILYTVGTYRNIPAGIDRKSVV